jgi:hypothetical protein
VAVERRVEAARRLLRTSRDGVAAATGVPARTVTRILARRGLPVLADCDSITGLPIRATRSTALRYEREAAGDLIHVDVKKIGRIPDGGGWRLHGRGERPAAQRGLGYDYVHVAIDDHSRAAYAEILTDERGPTCAGFPLRGRLVRLPRRECQGGDDGQRDELRQVLPRRLGPRACLVDLAGRVCLAAARG